MDEPVDKEGVGEGRETEGRFVSRFRVGEI